MKKIIKLVVKTVGLLIVASLLFAAYTINNWEKPCQLYPTAQNPTPCEGG